MSSSVVVEGATLEWPLLTVIGRDGKPIQFRYPDTHDEARLNRREIDYLAEHHQLCDIFGQVLTADEAQRRRREKEGDVWVNLMTPLDPLHYHAFVSLRGYQILRWMFIARRVADPDEAPEFQGEVCYVGEAFGYQSLRPDTEDGNLANTFNVADPDRFPRPPLPLAKEASGE